MFHKHGGDIYSYKFIRDFSANINFRGMPGHVRLAAVNAVDASVHYPDPEYRALRAALADRENLLACGSLERTENGACDFGAHSSDGGPEGPVSDAQKAEWVTPEQIICGNGAAELMFSLAAALKPRRALLAAPSFFEYEQALTAFGCGISHVFLDEKREFRLEESFFEAVSASIDLIILGSPNNPTGQLLERPVLERLIGLCRDRGIFLVLDESFFDFLSEDDRKRTLEGVREIRTNPGIFVIKSFTKMYAMPGLRFGYGICSDTRLLERMRLLMQPWNVSVPAAAAAVAAAKELPFAEETARQVAKNREQMRGWLEEAGYRVYPSCTNYLLFLAPENLKEVCLKAGYLIRDCSNFPGLKRAKAGMAFFRICIRGEEENAGLMEVLRAAQRQEK